MKTASDSDGGANVKSAARYSVTLALNADTKEYLRTAAFARRSFQGQVVERGLVVEVEAWKKTGKIRP